MTELDTGRERTDAKLRYAALHLDELKKGGRGRGGSDFDKAHQESYLFQLLGVRDALLQEISIYHSCGLSMGKVSRRSLKKALKDAGASSPALDALVALENDLDSWISCASEMRHRSTHRTHVPRTYHVGGKHDAEIFLTDTRKGQTIEQDYLAVFEIWFGEMKKLVQDLRSRMPGVENG
jgi:hypothetical protein